MGLFLESLPPTVAYDGNGPLDLGQWQRRPFPFLIFEQDALKKWFSYRIVYARADAMLGLIKDNMKYLTIAYLFNSIGLL